ILIGGVEVWQLAPNPATRNQIEFLFAEVDHLPIAFNQADTAAEDKGRSGGLCDALVRACRTLLGCTPAAGVPQGKIPLQCIQAAYEVWNQHAAAALRNAILNKEDKSGIPPLVGDRFAGYTAESIAARSTAAPKLWNRDESLGILRYYLEDQQQR